MKSNSKLISTLQSSIENYEKANKTQSEQIENQNLIINELHSKLQDYEAIAMQNNEIDIYIMYFYQDKPNSF